MKKRLFGFLSFIWLMMPVHVFAENAELNFCSQSGVITVFKIGGIVLYIAKIVVPLLLIIYGVLDLSKAVISGKSDATSKQVTSLVKRIVAGVIIFFVSSFVSAAFSLVDGYSNVANKFSKCMTCLVDVSKCK